MSTLTRAHIEWSRRAPDERFSSVDAMHARAVNARDTARQSAPVAAKSLQAVAAGDDVRLIGSTGSTAKLTHWSFGQLANRAKAPASYLRSLPAPLAAECINNGLRHDTGDARLLLNVNGADMTARAITSDSYSRLWNADITSRLLDLEAGGVWQPAPAAFDGSRGLYMGDADMFAFMVDNERRIFETLPGGGLSRGFFIWNSEVGAASFGICTFLYEYVCGNHRVWGASNVREIRFRHVGATLDNKAFHALRVKLIDYANASAEDDELRIKRMRETVIAQSPVDVIDKLMGKLRMSKKLATEVVDLAAQRVDWYGAPNTVWGIAGAITEIARDKPNASDRDELNRLGAKCMEVAF